MNNQQSLQAHKPVRHVGLSVGNVLQQPQGLAEFCTQLGKALSAHAASLREQHGIELHFHLPRAWHGLFGPHVHYLETRGLQRLLHIQPRRFDLWHLLHQHNRYRPPIAARQVVETIHDLNFLYQKTPAKVARYVRRMKSRVRGRTALVAISHYVAGDIERELQPRAPIKVIHNGVTDLTGLPTEPIASLQASDFILHISRLAPSKNVAAMLALASTWPEQAFVFAGARSANTEAVQAEIVQRGLNNVTLLLDVSEAHKAWLLGHCKAFLFISLSEGFGLPPLEAMHFGKTAFLSRLTSLPEVGGSVACYLDSFEPADMRARIENRLAQDAQIPQDAAIRSHAQSFTWEQCAMQHIALYRHLLGI